MTKALLLVGFLLLLTSFTPVQQVPPPASLQVSGVVARPLTWSATDLAQHPHVTVRATDKQGHEHRYAGVPLHAILEACGAVTDNRLHGKELRKALLVTAADQYEVFFALAELDPTFAARTIILADQCDGRPLPPTAGPWQVIVPGERKPARWIRQVVRLRVVILP